MTDLKICRICLIQDVRMYKHFIKNYEEIIDIKVNYTDGLPLWFCYECTRMLQKFLNFKEKCHKGLNLLKQLLEQGPLSSHGIFQLDRQFNGLKSSLEETSDSNTRVKTYIYIYKNQSKINSPKAITAYNNEPETDIKTENIPTNVLKNDKDSESNTVNIKNNNINDNELIKCKNYKVCIDNDTEISDFVKEDCEMKSKSVSNTNIVNKKLKRNTERTKTTQTDTITEANKFKRSVKKMFLDPNNWKKYHLTHEEAEREFKAREVNQQYVKANFKCSFCFRGFSQEDMLRRHLKLKHCESIGPFECRFCHVQYKWKSRLNKHLREHYTILKCLRCDLSFNVEGTALTHDQFHNGVTKTCPHCGETFRHSSTYYTHLRKHRSKYVCTTCGVSFTSEFGLYMHKKVKHVFENTEEQKTEEITFCEKCDIKFETLRAYEEHVAQSAMHTVVTDAGGCIPQSFKLPYTAYSHRRTPRKLTKCPTCEQNFSTYVAYSRHHRTDHPGLPPLPDPYKDASVQVRPICEICGISVAPGTITTHLNTHTRDNWQICNICGVQLASKQGLSRHRMRNHAEKCSICNKKYAPTTSLKEHYRTEHLKKKLKI